MNSKKVAAWFTTIAAITGVGVAAISLSTLVFGVNPRSPAEYIGSGVLLLLSFGTFKKSRTCAALLLGIYFWGRIQIVSVARHPISVFQPVALVFFLIFLLGVVGTFIWQAQKSKNKTAL